MAPVCYVPPDSITRRRFEDGDGDPIPVQSWLTNEYRVTNATWKRVLREWPPREPYEDEEWRRDLFRAMPDRGYAQDYRVINTILGYDTEREQCVMCRRNSQNPRCGQACLEKWFESGGMGLLRGATEVWPMEKEGGITGYGLFLHTDVRRSLVKGQLVGEYVGELLPADGPDDRRNPAANSRYVYEVNGGLWKVDAEKWGNQTRFINHSCSPNLMADTVVVGGRRIVTFRVIKTIHPGEELTVHYGRPYFANFNEMCYCNVYNYGHVPTELPL
ncbi:hypothetical protein PG995_000073 [Apiospora arundinis]